MFDISYAILCLVCFLEENSLYFIFFSFMPVYCFVFEYFLFLAFLSYLALYHRAKVLKNLWWRQYILLPLKFNMCYMIVLS